MRTGIAWRLPLLLALSAYKAGSQPTQGAAVNGPGAAAQSSPLVAPIPAPVHPMAAYLSLRPVLPAKPAFFPPVVDPNAFVDRKAWMLSNLFGAPMPAGAGAPSAPSYPFFGPAYFPAKKNNFLSNLYAGQQPPSAMGMATGAGVSGLTRRALSPFSGYFAPGVFAAKKTAFLQKLFETLNTTAPPPAPTTQPSWMDLLDVDSQSQSPKLQATLPRVPLSPEASLVDPAYYANKKTEFLGQLFGSIGLPPPSPAVARPTTVPPNYWSPFGAPQSPGVPFSKPTIVPPDFWTPSGIPTPGAIYKQKVADFLGKLFQQLNASSNINASDTEKRNVSENEDETELEGTKHESSIARRSITGTFGSPFGFGKPFSASPVDPQFFADKKSAFLSKLLASKGASGSGEGPGGDLASSSWGPYGGFYPTPKPTIVPPNFWNPFPAGKPIPAPSSIFSPLTVPAVKPTVVPPDFWSPFAALKQKNKAVPSEAVADSNFQTIDTLFDGGKSSCPFCADENPTSLSQQSQLIQQSPQALQLQSQDPAFDEDSLWDTFLKELAEASSAPVHRSSRSVSPEVARQQLQDSAMTQLTAIKDDMLNTVNSILKQKAEASAAGPAFPFGKSAYAAYGAMKKGGGGGPGAAGKKGGSPGKGGFPFWGGPPAAPTPDPTEPLQQRLLVLSNAFDSLATLQKEASAALQSVSTPDAPSPYAYAIPPDTYPPPAAPSMDTASLLQLLRAAGATNEVAQGKAARKSKSGKAAPRSIQFAVRQGQLSLPAGAEEELTAGGGASPDQHEGGGLRLQASEQDAEEAQMNEEEEEGSGLPKRTQHHHHSHHDR